MTGWDVITFLEQATEPRSFDSRLDLEQCVASILDPLEIGFFSCVGLFRAGGVLWPELLIGDPSHPWSQHYRAHKFLFDDPAAKHIRATYINNRSHIQAPWFSWSSVARQPLAPTARRVFDDAAQLFNLREGVVVPICGLYGELAFFSVAGAHIPVDDSSCMAALAMMLQSFYAHAMDLIADARSDNLGLGRLTFRQQEILQLRVSELTNQQIAKALGVSVGTVEAHVKGAFAALGVDKIEAAIGLAVTTGQIMPPIPGAWGMPQSH